MHIGHRLFLAHRGVLLGGVRGLGPHANRHVQRPLPCSPGRVRLRRPSMYRRNQFWRTGWRWGQGRSRCGGNQRRRRDIRRVRDLPERDRLLHALQHLLPAWRSLCLPKRAGRRDRLANDSEGLARMTRPRAWRAHGHGPRLANTGCVVLERQSLGTNHERRASISRERCSIAWHEV